MISIVNVKEFAGGIERAIDYIYGVWGRNKSYDYYRDAILHSSEAGRTLPRFYLLLRDGDVIGCYALVTNDFVSRHDLFPWFACLFVEERERGGGLGGLMMDHAVREAEKAGFSTLYLSTELDGYYEKYGWRRIEDGYELDGTRTRIYERGVHP